MKIQSIYLWFRSIHERTPRKFLLLLHFNTGHDYLPAHPKRINIYHPEEGKSAMHETQWTRNTSFTIETFMLTLKPQETAVNYIGMPESWCTGIEASHKLQQQQWTYEMRILCNHVPKLWQLFVAVWEWYEVKNKKTHRSCM